MIKNPHLKKISLIFPPSTSLLSWEPMVTMPMGIAYLASSLRNAGYEVSCLDTLVEAPYNLISINSHIGRYGLSYEQIIDWVKKEKPDVVGLSCIFSNQWPAVKELCSRIKRIDREIIVITGGTHPSFLSERCMRDSEVDFILRGEADFTLPELLNHIKNEKDYSKIDGLVWKENGEVRLNPKIKLIEKLDEIPFPARELFPVEKYFKLALPMAYHYLRRNNLPIFTSRGCPFRCRFCSSYKHWGGKFRVHSPERVLSEIEEMITKFGVTELKFQDDNLTSNKNRAVAIFQGMIDRGFNLTWNTPNGIAVWTLDEPLLNLMKRSGCFELTMAIESGDQWVMDNIIKKPLDLNKVLEINEILKRLCIHRTAYFIIGFPGESFERIKNTIRFSRSLKLDCCVIFIYNPLPGSELYEESVAKGYVNENDFFEGGGNQYFSSVMRTEDWTNDELERIIRREYFRNYWAAIRNPFIAGRKYYIYIKDRPNVFRFGWARTARMLRLYFSTLFKGNKKF